MRVGGQTPTGLQASSPLNSPRQQRNAPALGTMRTATRSPHLPVPSRPSPATCGRPAPQPLAAAKADPAPTIVSYTVQKGETLWDVAVQHGVSMRTVKELNKLGNKEPVLSEGQQLLVPASGISQLAAAETPGAPTALGSVPARGMWVGSEHVRLATIAEARQLYLQQCDRGNSQNTVLVLYAPWCPHCREMEDELERLAEGLSHVSAVRVVAVNGDSAEGRIFSREVLGVAYYPSIISFPEHSRTFYKYKGRQRDAESMLRFLNMTCCSRAREDQMWTLRPTGTRGSVAAVPGQLLPIGISPGAVAAAVGVLALLAAAAAAAVARNRRASSEGGSSVEPDMVAELDSSLGRMASLMLRAATTRLGLLLGLVGAPDAAAALAAAPPPPTAAAEAPAAAPADAGVLVAPPAAAAASASASAPVSAADMDSTRVHAGPAAPVTPAATAVAPAAAVPVASNGNGNGKGSSAAAIATAPAVIAAAPAAVAAAPAVVGTATAVATAPAAVAAPADADAAAAAATAATASPARELTAEERMRLTRLTDDELIALVNSDPDLDVVLSRLLGDK